MKRAWRLHDPVLLGLTLLATALGLFFVYDAGYARAVQSGRGYLPLEFRSQLLFLPVALVVGHLASKLTEDRWRAFARPLWVISLCMLLYVEFFGAVMNGAQRWISFGSIKVQPAEFVKLTAVLYLAAVLAGRKRWPARVPRAKTWFLWLDAVAVPKVKRIMPALWVLLAVVLIEMEPDLGTAAVVAFTAYVCCWAGGASRRSLIVGSVLAVVLAGVFVANQPYRLQRFRDHAQRWERENVDATAYQTVQSEMAMASGGLAGVGAGSGRAKHVMPATTTDFVLATVAEEFGVVGALGVLAVLGGIVGRLLTLAHRATSQFGYVVLVGVAAWIGVQTCVNVMMANGTLPAIGIPLPFISSGGSSLVALWLAIGVCQGLAAQRWAKEVEVASSRDGWRHRRPRLSRA